MNKPDHQHSAACIAMFEKLSEYIDNELDEVNCKDIERHAEECIKCRTCLGTLKRTIDLCREMDRSPVPEYFSSRLKEFIRNLS